MKEIKYNREEGINNAQKVSLPQGGLEELFDYSFYSILNIKGEKYDR